jgi:hypothetical protein
MKRGHDFADKWALEAEWARPHAGEMLTYLRGLLADPAHPGIRRCAKELIKQIEQDAERSKDVGVQAP